mmetsp:Transcript_25743/g.73990  ORF Transcript_25743/g.73990 Transcript_25743/m.73990 type:complete len:440 (-) Transcript_25743:48-1367(-)
MGAAASADLSAGVLPEPDELLDWRMGTESAGWIHMNSAGASPAHHAAHDAMVGHLELECAVGAYAAQAQSADAGRRDAHEALAGLLGCDASEIALAGSAQDAWAKAFYSLDFRSNDRILCFESEYAGNAVAILQAVKRSGCAVEVLPMGGDGLVDLDQLDAALATPAEHREGGPGRVLVALTHIQTNSSLVQPAAEVGDLAQAHGAVYLLDACQSFGQIPVDVRAIGCDFACGTGRKWLRGPRGTGFLYARQGVLQSKGDGGLVGEPPCIDHTGATWTSSDSYELLPDARRYEMFEYSAAGRAGLAAAVDACLAVGPMRIALLSSKLARRLRAGLREIPGVTLRDAPAEATQDSLCAIVAFDASELGFTADDIHKALAERKISASVSPAFHTFDEQRWAEPATVRLSPSYFNTEEEVEKVVEAVRLVLAGGDKASDEPA